MDARTKQVVNVMKANLHRNLSLSELANAATLSRSHLCYLFKTEMGMPPERYFRMLKMQEARRLLATSLVSVKQIMLTVGFTDKGVSSAATARVSALLNRAVLHGRSSSLSSRDERSLVSNSKYAGSPASGTLEWLRFRYGEALLLPAKGYLICLSTIGCFVDLW